MHNPYSITFGGFPDQYIPRVEQREEIIDMFNSSRPSTHAYLISDVRGSGKTVLLTETEKKIGQDWICIDLSVQDDMLQSFAAQLYGEKAAQKVFLKAKFDFSMLGLGVHVEGHNPAFDYQTAIEDMLQALQNEGKRVLVVIDEVSNTDSMRRFANVFQILLRKGLPIFLLMAGVPDNVYKTVNDEQSTFLLRTPRIPITPLNLSLMQRSYQKYLKVTAEDALKLAQLTNGYSFAFQALGYVCWGKNLDLTGDSFGDILAEYDYYLQDLSYEKIWEEMSPTDRRVAEALSQKGGKMKIADLRGVLDMNSSKIGVYRSRLKRKGVLKADAYGEVSFTLPRFDVFVLAMTAW